MNSVQIQTQAWKEETTDFGPGPGEDVGWRFSLEYPDRTDAAGFEVDAGRLVLEELLVENLAEEIDGASLEIEIDDRENESHQHSSRSVVFETTLNEVHSFEGHDTELVFIVFELGTDSVAGTLTIYEQNLPEDSNRDFVPSEGERYSLYIDIEPVRD
ncbi:hypothetical protein [Haloarchaeobius sp. DFWS5]|uniref:hypothetical protein n=1 Tax=Haloarchaeobius sp. DFWS5 TaxID=3446114 RepID=UPI003EB898B0